MSQKPLSSWDASLDRQEQEREENYFQQWRKKIREEKKKKKISKLKEKKEKAEKKAIRRAILVEFIYPLIADPLTFFLGVFLFDLYALAALFSSKIKLNILDIFILIFVNCLAAGIIILIIEIIILIYQTASQPVKSSIKAAKNIL